MSDDLLHISRTIRLHLYHSHVLQLIDGSVFACLAQEIVAAVDLRVQQKDVFVAVADIGDQTMHVLFEDPVFL